MYRAMLETMALCLLVAAPPRPQHSPWVPWVPSIILHLPCSLRCVHGFSSECVVSPALSLAAVMNSSLVMWCIGSLGGCVHAAAPGVDDALMMSMSRSVVLDRMCVWWFSKASLCHLDCCLLFFPASRGCSRLVMFLIPNCVSWMMSCEKYLS